LLASSLVDKLDGGELIEHSRRDAPLAVAFPDLD